MNNDILSFAKTNAASLPVLGRSSNEIRGFVFEGERYILKTSLMTNDTLSPFWRMMKNVFGYTFQRQNACLEQIDRIIQGNPSLPAASLVAADEQASVFQWMDGESLDQDAFPSGKENAYLLGKYVGFLHQTSYPHCGMINANKETDFFSAALHHMEDCIHEHWNGCEAVDQNVRAYFSFLKGQTFQTSRWVLMMADMAADQFLYHGEELACCVDLDAYVIGPAEWELGLLSRQVADWEGFKTGYELFQPLPALEKTADFCLFLMTLNECRNKQPMEQLMNELLPKTTS